MTNNVNPEEVFSAFEMYGHVSPIAGTYHVVDLRLEDSSSLLENQDEIKYFHDKAWLKTMSLTMTFCMIQKPLPVMAFSGARNILLLYQSGYNFHGDPTASLSSSAASYLGSHIKYPVKFRGKLLEFPNLKIMAAYFLWIQKLNRNMMIESMLIEALLANGTAEEVNGKLEVLTDEQVKTDIIKDFHGDDNLTGWHANGVLSYWSLQNDEYKLALYNNLPVGPDFLTLMMDLLGRAED